MDKMIKKEYSDEDTNPPTCDNCGDELSEDEIKNGEDTCYPCQKGNRN